MRAFFGSKEKSVDIDHSIQWISLRLASIILRKKYSSSDSNKPKIKKSMLCLPYTLCYIKRLVAHYFRTFHAQQHIHTSLPLFFSSLPTSLLHRRKKIRRKHRVYKNRIKVGVEEKKKTQGMRRDLGHKGCGPSPLLLIRSFGCFFYAIMGENWMTKMLENWEITDIFTSDYHTFP